jgi:hypothetical protein
VIGRLDLEHAMAAELHRLRLTGLTLPAGRANYSNGAFMSRLWSPFAALALAAALPGCQNECQQTCQDMAAYAEECGQEFPGEQLRQCRKDFARSAITDRGEDLETALQACEDARPLLREEWTCDDIAEYFDAAAAGGGGSSGGEDTGA